MPTPRKRDYQAEYLRRKERARAAGFSSPRTARTARERANGTTAFSRAEERARAEIRAREEGFADVAARRRFLKQKKENPRVSAKVFQKRDMLARFGISEKRFNEIRAENRDYEDKYGNLQFAAINTYDTYLDEETSNWSERRVGYIIAFNAAVVNRNSNYWSLKFKTVYQAYDETEDRYVGKIYETREEARSKTPSWYRIRRKRVRATDEHGKIITNANMFFYLVKYANIMSIDEFEARYGRAAIVEAYKQKVPEAA